MMSFALTLLASLCLSAVAEEEYKATVPTAGDVASALGLHIWKFEVPAGSKPTFELVVGKRNASGAFEERRLVAKCVGPISAVVVSVDRDGKFCLSGVSANSASRTCGAIDDVARFWGSFPGTGFPTAGKIILLSKPRGDIAAQDIDLIDEYIALRIDRKAKE